MSVVVEENQGVGDKTMKQKAVKSLKIVRCLLCLCSPYPLCFPYNIKDKKETQKDE